MVKARQQHGCALLRSCIPNAAHPGAWCVLPHSRHATSSPHHPCRHRARRPISATHQRPQPPMFILLQRLPGVVICILALKCIILAP